MQDLEEKSLRFLNIDLLFYYCYVDILLVAPSDKINFIKSMFYHYHNRLRFTLELEQNRCLTFLLDLPLYIVNNRILINWHRIFGKVLYFSCYPLNHKEVDIIFGLINWVISLSHPTFQQKNVELYLELLIITDNDYPIKIIFNKIIQRVRTLFNKKLDEKVERDERKEKEGSKRMVVFFYIKYVSKDEASFVNRSRHGIDYRSINKLNNIHILYIIKTHKDVSYLDEKNIPKSFG